MLPRSLRDPPALATLLQYASLLHHRTRGVARTSTVPIKSPTSIHCSRVPRPLHQLTDATRTLFTQHSRHYVQHHLDVCTVTALIDKQAFSDSIANRVRELSWGPKHHDCASPSDALRPGITPCVPRGPLRTQTNSQQSAILYLFSCSEERPQLQDRSCQFWISGTATLRHHAQRYARTSGAAPAQPFALTVHATRSAITAECAACGVDTLTRRTRLLRNAQLSE